jgi:hypothetical protein
MVAAVVLKPIATVETVVYFVIVKVLSVELTMAFHHFLFRS